MELSQSWLPYNKSSNSIQNVFCFHHAGGSGVNFTKWNNTGNNIRFIPIELPGRGIRMKEHCISHFRDAVHQIAEAIQEEVSKTHCSEFFFFGHSLGAIIAFCTAWYMNQQYHIHPKALFVAARHAPQMPDPSLFRSDMSDEAMVEELKRLGGTPEEILNCKEYLAMFTSIIRNDYRLHEEYHYHGEKIDIPIIAHAGTEDYGASKADMKAWSQVTDNYCYVEEFEGGHFFLYELGKEYVQHIADEIQLVTSGQIL